ncbi:restriction endonuclease subunit S [Alteromonas sp. KUL106]|uniref:restriction endonuclease subunit S n=1 Tax=Alteromonas sp. KUL106 TaxID=2480799 RepID=UPI0012E672E1|nr:restriction endonuclease subunit S [Alteromonas sp. KUL106]GFD66940.1 hypothetical protein KUL106_02030 [Alteromonas sp. KUL106]
MDKTIGLACNISTGKLDANQAVSGGEYPFFTCAEFPDQIDHFAYDDDVVLVAGNNARGNFHVSRYKGKFNAYQRTYILTAKEGFNIDYVYYALKLELKRLREKSQGSQTKFLTMPILTGIHFRDITGDEQSKIANVLSVIDKKIELNNRINAELEAMAKTLYDYWFVQFDFPDANGNSYKTSGGKMVYNPILKREIPEGWEVKNLGDISHIKAGGDKPTGYSETQTDDNQVPIFSNGITEDGLYGYTSKATIEFPSITVSARGTIGYAVLRTKPFVPIIRLLVLTPYHSEDIKFLDEAVKRIGFENSGSVQQQLTVPQISKINIIYPPQIIREQYAGAVMGSVKKIELLKEQSRDLKALRDWLLPMLMNGQVTVK